MIYLPYADFVESAYVMHLRTLVEELESICSVMEYLHQTDKAPENIENRLVKAWEGYEPQLCHFGLIVCDAIEIRGMVPSYLRSRVRWHLESATSGEFSMDKPDWIGREIIHLSHQSALIRHDLSYIKVFPDVPASVPLVWPD